MIHGGSLTPASAKSKGNCRRCKQQYDRTGVERICPTCRVTCVKCSCALTKENWDSTGYLRNQYYCRECVAKVVRETRDKTKQKDYDLKRNYGLSLERYLDLVAEARNCCEICRTPCDTLHVDHDHTTGEVRGLLCSPCNRGIGHLKDNIDTLKAAILYLGGTLAP